jgi:hypothetical protein
LRTLCLLASFAAALIAQPSSKPAPEQPLPFSHKTHASDLKLQCKMCHPNPDPGETMRIAAPAVCMQCHTAVKTDSPAIQKLAEAAKGNSEIRWVSVYEIPSYVNFSHRTHLASGNRCEECHGPVASRAQLAREGDISMGGCMECHRVKKAGLDCTYCHEQR